MFSNMKDVNFFRFIITLIEIPSKPGNESLFMLVIILHNSVLVIFLRYNEHSGLLVLYLFFLLGLLSSWSAIVKSNYSVYS